MEDVCFKLENAKHLAFCIQMQNQGCDVSAVNTLGEHALVWVADTPLLHANIVNMPQGTTCAGFKVIILPKNPKGKIAKRLDNVSYFDLMQYVCNQNAPHSFSPAPKTTNPVSKPIAFSAWSAPTNFNKTKFVFKN